MSNLTEEQRLRIVVLRDETQLSIRQIADRLHVTKSAVGRVVKSYQQTGIYKSRKFQTGRKRKTTAVDDRTIIRLSKKNPLSSSSDIRREMANRGVNICKRTVQNRLVEGGQVAIRPVKCQVLTPDMRKKRLEWALEHQKWTKEMWRSVSL